MHIFFGVGEKNFLLVEFSAGIIFPWEGKFPGGEFLWRNFTLGHLPELLHETPMFYFLVTDPNLRVEMLRVIVGGKFSPGSNRLENKSMGRRDLSMEM